MEEAESQASNEDDSAELVNERDIQEIVAMQTGAWHENAMEIHGIDASLLALEAFGEAFRWRRCPWEIASGS